VRVFLASSKPRMGIGVYFFYLSWMNPLELSIEDIRQEILRFKNDPDVQKLQSLYYSKSFSEILGVSRREVSHSRFLAWLLNNEESHMLGFFCISKFLEILVRSNFATPERIPTDFSHAVITDDVSFTSLSIETEKVAKGFGRVDIFIEGTANIQGKDRNIRIIIENKVESKEVNDQTTSYFNCFESGRKGNDICLYVFLTAIPTLELIELEEPECNCKKYIQINYQSIVDYLIEPTLDQGLPGKATFIINEYLQSLSQPSLDNDDTDHEPQLIMALRKEEKLLLSNFWKKNQKLILSALYAISSDPEQDKDTRESINNALENLSTGSKDRSSYRISYKDEVFVEDIKKADIGYLMVKLLEDKKLLSDDVIDFLKEDKSCSFPLIKAKVEVTDTEMKYRKYRVNDKPELIFKGAEYFVARNWGKGNTQRFIAKFALKFPGLKFEIY
jgi:hypothetical protein